MKIPDKKEITRILNEISAGDSTAVNRLMPLVYDELRSLARRYMNRESAGHTLQPTALVNEAYLKLVNQDKVDWHGRTHFFAVGATTMRRILVDHARRRGRQKHGGGFKRVTLDESLAVSPGKDEDILAVDDALERLEEIDPQQAKIVELRFFGGLKVDEVAEVLGVSKRKVEAEWTVIRAWLRRELSNCSGAA